MFENYISLGSNCLVASALSKHGFRSTSGPFDWCISNFMEGVIPLLECEFEDFLSYENLQVWEEKKTIFDDVKYKISYCHDLKDCLASEYGMIFDKYQRRIARFKEMVKMPTCFVRGCWSVEELSSLLANEDRINSAIAFNPNNEIIFVVPRFIYNQNPIKIKQKIFVVDTDINGFELGREEARSFFDSSEELLSFLNENYNQDKRKDNLIFDLQAELKVAKHCCTNDKSLHQEISNLKEIVKNMNNRLLRWMRITNTDYTTILWPKKVSIYGCGAIGRTFYNYIKEHVKIVEFIDNHPRQEFYDGVPVVKGKDSRSDKDTLIIIVPSYDYEEILHQLTTNLGFLPKTVRLEEFLAMGKVLDPNF